MLHYASHLEVTKLLLSHIKEPDLIKDKSGRTAFHYAAMNGKLHVLKLLHKAGANRRLVDHVSVVYVGVFGVWRCCVYVGVWCMVMMCVCVCVFGGGG